jgi:hypothetical protein
MADYQEPSPLSEYEQQADAYNRALIKAISSDSKAQKVLTQATASQQLISSGVEISLTTSTQKTDVFPAFRLWNNELNRLLHIGEYPNATETLPQAVSAKWKRVADLKTHPDWPRRAQLEQHLNVRDILYMAASDPDSYLTLEKAAVAILSARGGTPSVETITAQAKKLKADFEVAKYIAEQNQEQPTQESTPAETSPAPPDQTGLLAVVRRKLAPLTGKEK